MSERPNDIEAFIATLPDSDAARTFLDRLESLHPARAADCRRNPLLLSRLLTIAAYSSYLAETALRHPEHIKWLQRETGSNIGFVKSMEQLSEDLARFITRSLEPDQRTSLARFKRRELLRIYLRDCLAVATLSEVTEELSNLADVILSHALALAHQEMVNIHGAPLIRDDRGRISQAEFAIVALGKLGCRELNYSSDIDLLFLYSGEGETAGYGRSRKAVTGNREFFTGIAERVVQMIGSTSGEGAVYRIDLRLRPYGRDGDLVWEVERASDYYRSKAQAWERQTLIRARASAGSEGVVACFLDLVRDAIFNPNALPDTMTNVRRAKEKIDRKAASRAGGFDVKLGRGGIREIEFIAQALQLAHGGREPWVRSAQTLIVLARLAEKGYLTEPERARLSAAYTFLRIIEHRLQMEHGVQTHRLPIARERLDLVARRCGYLNDADPAAALMRDLEDHTSSVRAIFNRVFAENERESQSAFVQAEAQEPKPDDETGRLVKSAAARLNKMIALYESAPADDATSVAGNAGDIDRLIESALVRAINPLRSLRNLIAWAESLATYEREYTEAASWVLSSSSPSFLERLLTMLSSQYMSNILVSRPTLAGALVGTKLMRSSDDFLRLMRESVEREEGAMAKADALRRAWHRLVIETGSRDLLCAGAREGPGSSVNFPNGPDDFIDDSPWLSVPDLRRLRASNLEQTALAEAALRVALEIALASLGPEAINPSDLPFAIMALGRLGHTGMDYGSDLDLLVVYDDEAQWPAGVEEATEKISGFGSRQEFYAKLTTLLVRVLSSVTREGFLYRIDLRLRPDGKSGPVAQSLGGLAAYLKERASGWEHSAYLKVREVAGDLDLGARAREAICEAVFDGASRNPLLREELAAMRERLEKEKAGGNQRDVKWGRGGMTDVYFITRYLQLRDRVHFPSERGTTALVAHLGDRGSLDGESAQTLIEGYSFLRRLDHWMRLFLDRPGPVLPDSQIGLRDITRALGLGRIEEFDREYVRHTHAMRDVYRSVFESGAD